MTLIPSPQQQSFEALKRTNEHGAEFWSARDLQTLLGYAKWQKFDTAIGRAKASCEASGNVVENHFTDAGNMVTSQGRVYRFSGISLDKMCSSIHISSNRTLHASASACAPGGSFYAQIMAKAAHK